MCFTHSGLCCPCLCSCMLHDFPPHVLCSTCFPVLTPVLLYARPVCPHSACALCIRLCCSSPRSLFHYFPSFAWLRFRMCFIDFMFSCSCAPLQLTPHVLHLCMHLLPVFPVSHLQRSSMVFLRMVMCSTCVPLLIPSVRFTCAHSACRASAYVPCIHMCCVSHVFGFH